MTIGEIFLEYYRGLPSVLNLFVVPGQTHPKGEKL